MRNLGIVALCAALGGCAFSASDVTPAYVSPVAYQSYTCQQLALEAQCTADATGLCVISSGYRARTRQRITFEEMRRVAVRGVLVY
jgi:hypothetical protein